MSQAHYNRHEPAQATTGNPPDTASAAEKALKLIETSLARGQTIYVTTATRQTVITPRTAARWDKSGHKLFKILSDGCLAMASGRNYGRIATPAAILVSLRAT